MSPDYYKTLGISHTADLQAMKQAAQIKTNEIKTAFAILSQADTRTAYDAKLNQGPHNHYATLLVNKITPTAKIKAAAQARMSEIKEAFENLSKPETRAAYDSQWQSIKPTTPVAPSKPKREDVVVEPKPAPPLGWEKSQCH
jgi:DnaJ-class molecular chaperone